ncbi:hypothetical protein JW962_00220 [Candidatus Dojkabacteria bacterium]|nr:hypothetical protein [Candidatus Dojkabacteria bacterium]
MAKPTKHAPTICTILSVLAVIGIILSVILKSPLPVIFLLLPTIVYEVYRTEGESTKTSSIIILIVLILELVLIIFKIDVDLAKLLGQESQYIAGYEIPLGTLTVIGPTVMAILSVILFTRTRGVFTKWLAVNIFIGSFAIIYSLNSEAVQALLKIAIQKVLENIS